MRILRHHRAGAPGQVRVAVSHAPQSQTSGPGARGTAPDDSPRPIEAWMEAKTGKPANDITIKDVQELPRAEGLKYASLASPLGGDAKDPGEPMRRNLDQRRNLAHAASAENAIRIGLVTSENDPQPADAPSDA